MIPYIQCSVNSQEPSTETEKQVTKDTITYNSFEVTTTTTTSSLGQYTIVEEVQTSIRWQRVSVYATNANGKSVNLYGKYIGRRSVASLDEAFAIAEFLDQNDVDGEFTPDACMKLLISIQQGRIGRAKSAKEQVELLHNIVMEDQWDRPRLIPSDRKRSREE